MAAQETQTCKDVLEGKLNVARVESGGLDEREIVVACFGQHGNIVVTKSRYSDVLANCFASSVGTARRCLRSLLFPTSMMTMLESAWSRSSFNHRVTLS